jgi:hypothetical protein
VSETKATQEMVATEVCTCGMIPDLGPACDFYGCAPDCAACVVTDDSVARELEAALRYSLGWRPK